MKPDSSQDLKQRYDVIIVGGGMIGNTLACSLGAAITSDFRIAVIENNQPLHQWPEESFDLRVSAITRSSQHLLENLGVWENILSERATAYGDMVVWDAGGTGHIHFDCAEVGEPNLGHIIENRVINKSLTECAAKMDHIDYYYTTRPDKLSFDSNKVSLTLDNGTSLEADLVIGADGGNSWVRKQADIQTSTTNYNQTAVVVNVKTALPHQHTAWQRFLPTGPLAFLPLEENHSAIVWSTTPSEAERLCHLSNDAFNLELALAFDNKLGAIIDSGPRASFPIKGQHAKNYVKPQLALIGDAAHTIHPLAGQGVNLGFSDVKALTETIVATHHAHKPIGSYKTLRRYERSRRGDNMLMLEAMGLFKRLFSNNVPGLRELRNVGLNLTDRSTQIKNIFMNYALGLSHQK